MADVEIKFEREGLEGIVPVGTYLADAAKRMGVRFDGVCVPGEGVHFCDVTVNSGGETLSAVTSAEKSYFGDAGPQEGHRLACQARIEKPGELSVMTGEKKKDEKSEKEMDDRSEAYKKEFAEMPLEKKIASLVQLEAIALGETFSFILNSPYLIFDKAMDVMAEFGFRKEEESRKAGRPEEHTPADEKAHKGKGRGSDRKKKAGTNDQPQND